MTLLYLTTRLRKSLLISFILSFLFIYTVSAQLLVKDINAGIGSAAPEQVVEMGGILYFVANDPTYGKELWRSDGTTAGTYMVKDIKVGVNSSAIDQLTVMGDSLYFEANEGTNGNEIWLSDGTTSGTKLLKDINGGSSSSSPDYFCVMGSTLYFSAYSPSNGKELWKTDGSTVGTVEVKNIRPSSSNSYPKYLTTYNGEVYFQANDGTNGTEVWKSDGTSDGTILLKNIRSGSSSAAPSNFCTANGLLFFKANDGINGTEVWVTDGTELNTSIIDINTASGGSSYPGDFYEYNNKLYCSAASNGTTFRVWTSDGVTATQLGNASVPANFFEWNGTLYYSGSGELWSTDGVTASMLKDINTGGPNYSYPAEFTIYANKLFFTATDATNGTEVWMTDGTEAGTQLAMDINDGSSNSSASQLKVANNMLFFGADDGNDGSELRLIGNCDVSLAPVRKDAGTHFSLFEKTDGNGWTHYCDCANNVLLSLEKGSTGAVIPSDGVSVKIEATTAEHHASGCVTGDCFISASGGAVVFNRSWDVSPTTQPTSDIPVRFYFSNEEYDAINTEMGNQSMTPLIDPNQMSFFKVTEPSLGSHPAVEDVTSADVIVLAHDGGAPAAPSLTTWVKTSFGTDYYAEFLVSSFSGGGGGAADAGETLPVEMMYFWARAIPEDNETHMEWSTASEINNYGFFIERSFDLNNWEIIGFVESNAGASSPSVNVYQFVDEDPNSGTNYYRLHQRDYDGAEDYSEVVHVKFDVELIGDVYPNPVSKNTEVQIDITTSGAGPGTVEVYDISRQLLIKNQHDLKNGQQLLPLNISGLSSGMYIVKVEARGAVVNTKLLIQE